nr:hypothetical protein Iba_chr12aCG23800 [Ipomoea batatas]
MMISIIFLLLPVSSRPLSTKAYSNPNPNQALIFFSITNARTKSRKKQVQYWRIWHVFTNSFIFFEHDNLRTLLSIIFKLRRRREARSKRIARYPAEQRTRWAEYYYSAATTAAANSSSPASSSAPEGTCPSPESETSPLSASSTQAAALDGGEDLNAVDFLDLLGFLRLQEGPILEWGKRDGN